MMEPREIHLASITSSADILLTGIFKGYLLEAAQFCLGHHAHPDGTLLGVDGSYQCGLRLRFTAPQDVHLQRTFADHDEAAEYGAYGMAFVLILTLTEHRVIERSAKGTGFDFWLGERGGLGFQKSARLEVSGIFANPAQVTSRTILKIGQTMRSDHIKIPVYVVVVEFSCPTSKVIKR